MKYGKRLEFEDIKIGEAFYFTGCAGFGIKVASREFIVTASDGKDWWQEGSVLFNSINHTTGISHFGFYDIPESLRECLEVR